MIYITGPEDQLEALGATLSLEGHDAHLYSAGMDGREIYDEILACDAVLMAYEHEQTSEMATELGIALALGKPIYVIRKIHHFVMNRFMDLEGVRIFKGADEALEALLADLETNDDRQTSSDELGQLGGLGTDPSSGGDSEPVP